MKKLIIYTLYHNPMTWESVAAVHSHYKTLGEAEEARSKKRIDHFRNGDDCHCLNFIEREETEEECLKMYDEFHSWFVVEEDFSWIFKFINP